MSLTQSMNDRPEREAALALLREVAAEMADAPDAEAVNALLAASPDAARVLAERGARDVLAEARSLLRAQLERQARRHVREKASFVIPANAATAATARADYYGWPLPISGVRLGDANERELAAAAEYHRTAAAGELKRAGQYEALAERLRASGARVVREGLTPAEVAEIIAEVRHAAE